MASIISDYHTSCLALIIRVVQGNRSKLGFSKEIQEAVRREEMCFADDLNPEAVLKLKQEKKEAGVA